MRKQDMIDSILGEPRRVDLREVADDPRWPMPELDLEQAERVPPSRRAPLVAREAGDGTLIAVCPASGFSAAMALGARDGSYDAPVHVLPIGAEDAELVHEAVEWYCAPGRNAEWARRLPGIYERLKAREGSAWMVGGPWRFLAAACGTGTAAFSRVKALAEGAGPEICELFDEGVLSMRITYEASKLDQGAQRDFARAVREEAPDVPATTILRRFNDDGSAVARVLRGINLLLGPRSDEVALEDALRIQAAADELVILTSSRDGQG